MNVLNNIFEKTTHIARNDRFCPVGGEFNDNDPEFIPLEKRQCATRSS